MIHAGSKPKKIIGITDYRIILSTLEADIIKGETPEKYSHVLKNRDNWINMPIDSKIRWARLAQIAGEMDTALEVFLDVNKKHPDNPAAWEDHISLLVILGKQEKAAEILSRAASHIGKEIRDKLSRRIEAVDCGDVQDDLHPACGPFDQLRAHQQRIDRFISLFSGRDGCFARQWVNRDEGRQGYVPVQKPFTAKDAEDHLNDRRTYGM